jgi:predicted Co/Zn/Cd cation transporter (cation efflux family)
MDWAAVAYTAAALLCAAAATVIALGHIYRHLLHYAEPIFQRFIVRIIFMVPVRLPSSARARLPPPLASDLSLPTP